MAAIGSLLGIVDIRKADGLVLATGEVPALLVGDTLHPLAMPPLTASVLESMLGELLPPEERGMLAALGKLDRSHAAGVLGTFALRVRTADARTTVTLRRRTGDDPIEAPARQASDDRDDGVVGAVLDQAMARHASDVLFSPGLRPRLRVDGIWIDADAPGLASPEIERAFVRRLSDARRRLLEETGSVDLAFGRNDAAGTEVRFRVSLFRQHTGVAAALRPLWTALESLDDLNLPAALLPMVGVSHGLVLVTGATGSGKSTTLAALLEWLNGARACHIVTLEDPIEYVFRPRRAVIHQREIGTHVDSFASGLRAALRGSPDIILVGEMRDRETIRLALTAAETGHLVMSTLHSGTATMAVDRIVDAFDDAEKLEVRQQLATALRYVIAQQLITAADGQRIPALELLTVTPAVAAQIREGRTHLLGAQMELEAGERMVTMERALAELVRTGRIARQVALEATQRPDDVRRLLAAAGTR